MESSDVRRASDASQKVAAALGLDVDQVIVVHNSDRIALRLLPCDVLARVAPASWREGMQFEAVVARRLTDLGSPVGELDPRVEPDVYTRDGFAMTFWTHYDSVGDVPAQHQLGMSTSLPPAVYARALAQLHADLRRLDLEAPHVMDRVSGWIQEVEDPGVTPDLRDQDRDLLSTTLRSASTAIREEDAAEQLLHGEPHPGNVLDTENGAIWIDVGTLQRGPIEYDLAYAPVAVGEHYPGANHDLTRTFRILMWAGVATMRWNQNDQYPRRDDWRIESLRELRAAQQRS